MDYAIELESGKVIAAANAPPYLAYKCPRPNCGGRVYLPNVSVQRPHFRHYPGEGTPACDQYFPGDGNGGEFVSRPLAAVEEDPAELGLLLSELDGRWGLGLRLPEIPSDELGGNSLAALRSAHVDVYVGQGSPLRMSALDLRPGIGVARVEVAPTLHAFRTQSTGAWPSSIDCARWNLEARGLQAMGVLFRLRLGEWTRLVAGSAVHLGETVLVLADARHAPPMMAETHQHLSGGGLQWCIWEAQLPNEPQDRVTSWLSGLGHPLVPRPWIVDLVTPPRAFSEGGLPVFWVKDSPVLELEAPKPSATAMVELQSGTNSYLENIHAVPGHAAHVTLRLHDVGLTRFAVAGERGLSLRIGFERPPSLNGILDQLARTPRLRIRFGQQDLEAWRGTEHQVVVSPSQHLNVQVDLGVETARACVTFWERGRRRVRRGLDSRGVERAIDDAIATASKIEVDADNLGRIVVLPIHREVRAPREHSDESRLAWWDETVGIASQKDPCAVPTVVARPGFRALSIRRAGGAALVRARLALRRRLESGESSP